MKAAAHLGKRETHPMRFLASLPRLLGAHAAYLSLLLGLMTAESVLAQQAENAATPMRVEASDSVSPPNAEQSSASEPVGSAETPGQPDGGLEHAAHEAAIKQAIEDLQANRKAQQAQSASRTSLSSRNAPDWQRLLPKERVWLEPLAQVWHELPSPDRWAWLQLARQLPKLPQAARDQAQERMKQWSTYTPQQRQAARENFRLAQRLNDSKLSAGQLQALWERYRELTPEQRAVLRAAGQTASTAARHAGAATPLARAASRPLTALDRHSKQAP